MAHPTSGISFSQLSRCAGSTGPAQQTPPVVTCEATQHWPPTVGILPGAQHIGGVIGGMTIFSHWLLFGPLGICPTGQQMPVEVAWLARQQDFPIGK
ncbi:MAG: hypothetical protein WA820_06715 [Bradyrhizobium sp.]